MLVEAGYENLHVHTDYSTLDGYAKVEELGLRAKEINQQYLCVSDHGMMGVVPNQIKVCDEYGLEPIFASELYVNPMQPAISSDEEYDKFRSELSDEEKDRFKKSYHLLAIAHSEQGYANLVQLTSWGWIYGRGGRPRRPRVNHEQLKKYSEGIFFTSTCYNSEIAQAFDKGGDEAGFAKLEEYLAMFNGQFYLEMMLLDFSKQRPYNEFLVRAKDRYGLPMIITNDCHYCKKEDSKMQRYMLMVQTGRTIQEIQAALESDSNADFFELQDSNLWFKSEEELNDKWKLDFSSSIDLDIFNEAKLNTVKIAEMARGVKLDRSLKLPELPDANEKLKEAAIEGFKKRNLPKTKNYLGRLKEELGLIKRFNFSSYFLIEKMAVDEARRYCAELFGTDGSEAVGPGRGSGAGSLCNYCLEVTDVDPIKHNLLFERFISEARCGRTMNTRFTIDPINAA